MTALPHFDAEPLCAETDPALFFPEDGDQGLEAKWVCARCELTEPCLDYALRFNVDGIWAGTSNKQRVKIRRQLGIVAERMPSTIAAERAETALRMSRRGSSAAMIARHLDVTEEAVHRILRATS